MNKLSLGLIMVGALGLVALGALVTVLLIGAGGRYTGNDQDRAAPTPQPTMVARTTPAAERTPAPIVPVASPPVPEPTPAAPTPAAPTPPVLDLPTSYDFSGHYYGKIGGAVMEMTLYQSGERLTGSASAGGNQDRLVGRITNSEGRFHLVGTNTRTNVTENYDGQLSSDGMTIQGQWTDENGKRPTGFWASKR